MQTSVALPPILVDRLLCLLVGFRFLLVVFFDTRVLLKSASPSYKRVAFAHLMTQDPTFRICFHPAVSFSKACKFAVLMLPPLLPKKEENSSDVFLDPPPLQTNEITSLRAKRTCAVFLVIRLMATANIGVGTPLRCESPPKSHKCALLGSLRHSMGASFQVLWMFMSAK